MKSNVLHNETELLEALAEELRAQVARNRISQRDLAQKSKLALATINKTLTGARVPDFIELYKICNALNIDMFTLMENVKQSQKIKVKAKLSEVEDKLPEPRSLQEVEAEYLKLQKEQDSLNQSDYSLVAKKGEVKEYNNELP